MSIMLLTLASLAKMAITNRNIFYAKLNTAQTFYIAEAGTQWAKWKLSKDPAWATDSPHSPSDDIKWLLNSANGYTSNLGDGCYKIIKEVNRNIIYSIGYVGNEIKIIKITYEFGKGFSPFYSIW